MFEEGLLSHQESVLNIGDKMGLIVGDGGIETVVMQGIGKEVILVQDSVGEVSGPEIMKSSK